MFTARVFGHVRDKRAGRTKETLFDRESAWKQLPETNPFLRKLFKDVSERSAEELGDELIGAIADIFVILRATKMDAILSDFEMKMNREDIVIRFYEDFLAAYKPQMRERRGVYYTPEPVVSYMVRSVDILVKEKFNKPLGLADPEVMILDPACGTGTFLLWICKLIYQRFQESPAALTEGLDDKSWSGYVKERLLPRIFGFELLMSPYAIAHLKIGLFLEETGYQVDSGKRLGIYLINTLEDITLRDETQQLNLAIPQMEELIAEEARAGSRIKKQEPIMVVIGNPPYSANSLNNGLWVKSLVQNTYYPKDEIKEPNPKLLLDDYVKFIRFSQWRIDNTGKGILAFVTNHGYLDNLTFRGMRQSLASSFDWIRVLDLHGNSKKKETVIDKETKEKTKDENVFDIQQGVATCLMVKNEILLASNVEHAHLYGMREAKYEWLSIHDVSSTGWTELIPEKPFSLFTPQNNEFSSEYQEGWKISDAMPVTSAGIKTNRDHLLIDFKFPVLLERIKTLAETIISDDEIKKMYNLVDSEYWNTARERQKIRTTDWQKNFTSILYRPFDIRRLFYQQNLIEIGRGGAATKVMGHMIRGQNLGLIATRQFTGSEFYHILCSSVPIEMKTCSHDRGTSFFPLYIIPDPNNPQTSTIKEQRRPNFSEDFIEKIEINLGYLPTPETIFYYIYAVFHSPRYRTRYAEFLKIDFPRVPLTTNNELFCQLAEYGEELVALHLMKSPKLNNLITQFTENGGSQIVDAGHPKYTNGAVVINKKGDKFVGVPEDVWNFYIGGYQVCQKWLKDRKNRPLSDEDILHYQKIIVVLQETIKLMQQIDETIPQWPFQ